MDRPRWSDMVGLTGFTAAFSGTLLLMTTGFDDFLQPDVFDSQMQPSQVTMSLYIVQVLSPSAGETRRFMA